jgi:hypothetical protein
MQKFKNFEKTHSKPTVFLQSNFNSKGTSTTTNDNLIKKYIIIIIIKLN